MPVFVFFLFAFMFFSPLPSLGDQRARTQVFETEGIAAVSGYDLARARDGAVRDALQKAVMLATEQWLTPRDAERTYEKLKERIYDRAEEFTQDFRILFELSDQDIYSVTVRATVFSERIKIDLQGLGFLDPPVQTPSMTRFTLTIRGIRGYGDFVRVRGVLKDRTSGIREALLREASWRTANFDVVTEGTVAAVADWIHEKLSVDVKVQDDRSLEFHLK